eukprot:scaffold7974_cov258-Pinguiococcus_pyrenoidosus.AAC.2
MDSIRRIAAEWLLPWRLAWDSLALGSLLGLTIRPGASTSKVCTGKKKRTRAAWRDFKRRTCLGTCRADDCQHHLDRRGRGPRVWLRTVLHGLHLDGNHFVRSAVSGVGSFAPLLASCAFPFPSFFPRSSLHTQRLNVVFLGSSNRFRRRLADRLRAWVGASEQKPKKKKKTSSKVVVAHPVRYSDVKGSANGKMPPTAPASALQEALAAVEAAKRVADAVDASIESISDSNVRSKVLDATQAALEVAETAAKEARQRVDAAEAPTPAAPTPAAPSGVAQVGGDETLATVKKAREATDDYHARMEDYRQRME